MKAIDTFIGLAITAFFIVAIFLPSKITLEAICGLFVAVGLYSVLFPQGLLGWAKAAHPEIDPTDERLWWVPRCIGICFIVFSVLIVVMFAGKS